MSKRWAWLDKLGLVPFELLGNAPHVKLASSATAVTIASSSSAGTLFTQSITGAKAGDTYQLTLFGNYYNASGSASTGIFTVTLGSTSIASTATSWNSGAQFREWRLVVDIVVGTLSTQQVGVWVTQASATADAWPMATTAAGAAPGYTAMSEDLSSAKTLAVTHTHSVNNSLTQITCAGAVLSRLR